MPRIDGAADTASGLRDHLIGKARAEVAKLSAATCDWYDFTADLHRQRDRLLDLASGEDVLFYRFEVPRETPAAT